MKDPLVRLTLLTQAGSNSQQSSPNHKYSQFSSIDQLIIYYISTHRGVYLISDCICTIYWSIVCIQCTVYTCIGVSLDTPLIGKIENENKIELMIISKNYQLGSCQFLDFKYLR